MKKVIISMSFGFEGKFYYMTDSGRCYVAMEDLSKKNWEKRIRISYVEFQNNFERKHNI